MDFPHMSSPGYLAVVAAVGVVQEIHHGTSALMTLTDRMRSATQVGSSAIMVILPAVE
jgi:hypothetical protein